MADTSDTHEAASGGVQSSLSSFEEALQRHQERTSNEARELFEQFSALRVDLETEIGGEAYKKQIAGLESEVAQLSEALRESRGQAEKLEKQQQEAAQDRERDQARIHELEQETADQAGAATAARERVESLQRELSNLREEFDALTASSKDDAEARASAEQALEALQAESDSHQQALKEAQTASERDRQALEEAEANTERNRKALEEAEADAERNREALEEAKAAVESAKADLETAQAAAAKAETLGEELEQLRQENTRLEQALAEAPAPETVQELRQALDTAHQEAREHQTRLLEETSRGNKALLATQLADALQDADSAQEKVRVLERELETLRGAAPAPPAASTEERVRSTIAAFDKPQKTTIGEILLESGVITQTQLEECLEEQRRNPHQHLGAIFVERGHASQEAVALSLACQCGAPYIRISEVEVSNDATAQLQQRLAQKHVCIPIRSEDDEIVLAMANPIDLVAIEDIERATGRKVQVVVSTEDDIAAAIAAHYAE